MYFFLPGESVILTGNVIMHRKECIHKETQGIGVQHVGSKQL